MMTDGRILDIQRGDGESWWQIGKNGRTLFDRPKHTVGCSANGRGRKRRRIRDLQPVLS